MNSIDTSLITEPPSVKDTDVVEYYRPAFQLARVGGDKKKSNKDNCAASVEVAVFTPRNKLNAVRNTVTMTKINELLRSEHRSCRSTRRL